MTTVRGCEMFCVCFWSGCGICAVSPCSLSIDTTTMKTMISVSSTSISGVTLISGPRAPPPAIENDIESSTPARACLHHQTPGTRREFPLTILLTTDGRNTEPRDASSSHPRLAFFLAPRTRGKDEDEYAGTLKLHSLPNRFG